MATQVMYEDEQNKKEKLIGKKEKIIVKKADFCVFTQEQLLERFYKSDTFREAIMTGVYIYHENRLVLCRSDLLDFSNKKIRLSNKVTIDPEEYCLSQYKIKYPTPKDRRDFLAARKMGCHFQMSRLTRIKVPVDTFGNGVRSQIYISHARAISNESEIDFEGVFNASLAHACAYVENGNNNDPNLTFQQLFTMYMEDRGFSANELYEKTGIDARTIRRMKNEEGYSPSLDYVVICCLAMKLHFSESNALLYLGGYLLRDTVKKERAYKVLLQTFYEIGVITVYDNLLEKMGVETFTEIIEKARKKQK